MSINTIKLELTDMAYGGEALGRLPDGRVAFVPYSIPGETVRVRLVDEKPRYVRAELIEVLRASPKRIQPRCTHFTNCGGCHYQHIPYQEQLQTKSAILQDQLKRIGNISEIPILPPVASPCPWNYRNHVQFHLDPLGKLGYLKTHSEEVLAIRECHLPESAINSLWPLLDFEPIPGLERIGLRLGADEDMMLILESRDWQAPRVEVEELPISVVHLSPAGSFVMVGSEYVCFEILGRSLRVSAASFFQVNTAMAALMVEHLLDRLPLTETSTVVEVYCGVGLFSAFIAARVKRLICIEASPAACQDFVINLDEFDNVELYKAPTDQVLPHLELKPDIILVDPPRSGIDRRSIQGILNLAPSVLAYVSCDPSTLSRDARQLIKGGYRLKQITPFDLFPQTYHIESISLWERGG